MGSHYNGLSLGLCYMASLLKENGYEVKIYNADYLDDPFYSDQLQLIESYKNYKKILGDLNHSIWHEIKQKILDFSPDFIGIQMYTATFKSARNIAEIAKGIDKDIKIVVGGTHPTLDPVSTLKSGRYDYAVFGEGEFTFLDLVNGKEVNEIPGLAYKTNNKTIKKNIRREFIENLNLIPFPLRSGFINGKDFMDLGAIITSRGCPFECTYCVSPTIWKRKVRYRSVNNVLNELEYMKKIYNVDLIRFQDDTFTLNKKRALDLCKGIIERGLNLKWVCETRVDRVDLELLQMMKEAGCIRLKVGVESGSDNILKKVKKGITKTEILRAVSAIKKTGIPLTIFLMLGFPGETDDDVRATIRFANEIEADYNSLSIIAPYYGTEMFEQMEREGFTFDRDHWEYFFHQSKDMILNTTIDPHVVNDFFDLNKKSKGKRV